MTLVHEEFEIKVPAVLSNEVIKGLLSCAFEGGSNYWYVIAASKCPKGTAKNDFGEGGKMQGKEYWHWSQLIPLCPGGALVIRSLEDDEINGQKSWVLNRKTLARGARVMAEKYPHHWANAVRDNADAETGDVFLQCCLFGELVYG
jgi:hypothetical protein